MSELAPPTAGFAALSDRYDVVLCDVWGVLHDGVAAHIEAADALARFREGGGAVVLVSNAPKPSEWVVENLDGHGVPRAAWDAIVTSGDVARRMLAERDVWRVHHIGPARDLPLLGDGRIARVAVDEAETVVVTGLVDDQNETPEDYADALERIRARDLPMICANPDLVVQVGDRQYWCAGALADMYQRLGGETHFAGKPYPAVYDAALAIAGDVLDRTVERSRAIAIGDAVRTDLAGATGAGLDCVFVADGIHREELGGPELDATKLKALLDASGYAPVAVMRKLTW